MKYIRQDSGCGNSLLCRFLGCSSRGERRYSQLHLVPRRIGARLHARATLGRTAPKYIEKQLVNFREHTRDGPFSKQYMWGAAAHLSAGAARSLAIYFSTIPPKAANDGDRELVATGRAIYQVGVPDSNIAACVACHGPNAQGVGEIPRLGGLAYTYLKRRLEQWGQGYHAAAGPPMPHIASQLSLNQIEALASYLSFVK